jgi:hypothetical protein
MFAASAAVIGEEAWVQFISRYDAPWRDLQLAGFAGGMILGVSQRFLPFIYGFREVPRRRARAVLLLWNIGVAGNIATYSMGVRSGEPVWAILLEFCLVAMFAAVLLLV